MSLFLGQYLPASLGTSLGELPDGYLCIDGAKVVEPPSLPAFKKLHVQWYKHTFHTYCKVRLLS